MCGRVACSNHSVESAKGIFANAVLKNNKEKVQISFSESIPVADQENSNDSLYPAADSTITTCRSSPASTVENNATYYADRFERLKGDHDNWNLSPGMKSTIFHRHFKQLSKNNDSDQTAIITCSEQIWGLVPKPGTKKDPIPPGPSKHFANLMFNARSDTLYDKRTFRDLLLNPPSSSSGRSQTCIWAIDGYYEWKAPDGDVLNTDKKKQPYYVFRKDGKPLFIPGLWTSVCIGGDDEHETLKTFTMLTTDASKPIRWLHHRQPVMISDENIAIEWLLRPSKALLQKISVDTNDKNNISIESDPKKMTTSELLSWHPVTKKMSNTQYKNPDCTKPIKIEKVPSIKSFFSNSPSKKSPSRNKTDTKIVSNDANKAGRSITVSSTTSTAKAKKRDFFYSSKISTKSVNTKKASIKDLELVDLTKDDEHEDTELTKRSKRQKVARKSSKKSVPPEGISKFFTPKSKGT